MGNDAAEFANKRPSANKTQKNVDRCRLRRRAFHNLGNVSGFDDECGDIHGKHFLDNRNSIVNTAELTLKQMFDISEKLVSQQEEINNVDKIHWEKHSWNQLSLMVTKPTEFEWNIFPRFTMLLLCGKVTDLLSRLGETPENFTGRFFSCRCSTTFLVTRKTMKKNVWQMPESSPYL